MSLEDTTTIDIVVKPPSGQGLDLVLCDGGEVEDELRRYQLIVEKLISYVEFVATGQHLSNAPEVRTEDISIRVICKNPPNDAMKQIVSVVSRQHPNVRLPVVLEMEGEFRQRMGLPEEKRPWWKLW